MRGYGAAAVAMLALMTSCVADRDADGSTATIEAPARKVAATAMLQKLDLNVPTDLEVPPPGEGGPALAAAPAFNAFDAGTSPDDAARALDCLTQAVYYEAGNQSDDGERAVAQVVLTACVTAPFPPACAASSIRDRRARPAASSPSPATAR